MQLVVEHPAEHRANHHPRRPAGVEDVEEMRAVVREEGGNERISHGFRCAPRIGEDKHASVKHVVSVGRHRQAGHNGGHHVQGKGDCDQFAVADFVHNDAANDDAEAETAQASAADGAELRGSEAEFRTPVVQNAASDAEPDTGCQNRHESRP